MTSAQQYEQQKKTLRTSITQAVDKWFTQACHNPALPQFIFYKPHAMQVSIAAVSPGNDWVQACAAEMPNNVIKSQAWQITFDALRECPVYPVTQSAA